MASQAAWSARELQNGKISFVVLPTSDLDDERRLLVIDRVKGAGTIHRAATVRRVDGWARWHPDGAGQQGSGIGGAGRLAPRGRDTNGDQPAADTFRGAGMQGARQNGLLAC